MGKEETRGELGLEAVELQVKSYAEATNGAEERTCRSARRPVTVTCSHAWHGVE